MSGNRIIVKRLGTGTATFQSSSASGASPAQVPAGVESASASTVTITKFGPFEARHIETVFYATNADAEERAEYLAAVNEIPKQIFEVTIDVGIAANAAIVRDLELNDRVFVREDVTQTEIEGFVESIEHQISNAGNLHLMKIVVSVRGRECAVFCSDFDAVDGPDVYSQFTADPPSDEVNYAVFGL